jgi:hypothetical protein
MEPRRSSGGHCYGNLSAHRPRSGTMPDDPKDVVEAAIRSAFVSYPKKTTRIGQALTGLSRRNARIWRALPYAPSWARCLLNQACSTAK